MSFLCKSNTTNVTIKCLFFPSSTGTGDFTVAFIGSGDGYLKKVVIESDSTGVLYADIPIRPGHSVRPDIVFDLKREHVYVMTDKKVSKVCLLWHFEVIFLLYFVFVIRTLFSVFCFFYLLPKDLIITEKLVFFIYLPSIIVHLSRIYPFLQRNIFMQFYMQFLLSLKKFLVIICKSHHFFKKIKDILIFMILYQYSFFLLNRFECKIVQCIPIVDNAWAQKTLIVAGVPWRTSARFGVTVEMQHRIPCIGSHTNQDDAPQSLQCSPMNCSELLPGIIYPLFALITQYIF